MSMRYGTDIIRNAAHRASAQLLLPADAIAIGTAYLPLVYYNNSQLFHFPIFDGARTRTCYASNVLYLVFKPAS